MQKDSYIVRACSSTVFFPPDHKKELITVPSCEFHNSEKSDDDEYIRAILVAGLSGNKSARTKIFPFILRAFQHAPKKASFYQNLRPARFGAVFTGDLTLEEFVGKEDPAVVRASWQLLRDRGAKRVYPGHGPERGVDARFYG